MNVSKASKETYMLINDSNYLNWLKNIIDKKGYLDTDLIWENYRCHMSNQDISNVKSLSNLYFEISSYAYKVYIYGMTEENDTFYIIKINNDYYRVGVTMLPGQIRYFCYEEQDPAIEDINIVDISDLSRIDYRAALIEEKLNEIIQFIDKSKDEANIPLKAILDKVNAYISEQEEV